MTFNELYSPVKIINEFVQVPQPLPDASLSGLIIGDNIKRVTRIVGTIPTQGVTLNLILEPNESLVDYSAYISPISKRQYVFRLFDLKAIDDKNNKYQLIENVDYIIDETTGLITFIGQVLDTNKYAINIGEILTIAPNKVASLFTSKGYLLKVGDYILVGYDNNGNPVFKKVIGISNGVIQLESGSLSPNTSYQVYRTITEMKLEATYRVFVSHDKIYKVSPSDIERLFGPIEPSNLIAYSLFLAFTSQPRPKALYACPLKTPFDYSEAYNRVIEFMTKDTNVIPYEIMITSLRDQDVDSLRTFIADRNNPDNSIPVRAWITKDIYLYEPEYRLFGKAKSNLIVDNQSHYQAWYYDDSPIIPTNGNLSFEAIFYNGSSLLLRIKNNNDSSSNTIEQGNYLLVFKKNSLPSVIYFKFKINSNITISAGETYELLIKEIDNELEVYRFNFDNVGNKGILAISKKYYVSQNELGDYNLENEVKMFPISQDRLDNIPNTEIIALYTPLVKPITGDDSIAEYIYSQVTAINDEHINYVNPWVFTPQGNRLPGFFLCAMKVGQSVGMDKISEPLSAHPLPRTYISYADYSNNIFDKDTSKWLMENGYDMHVVYDNIFQSWWQRTTYTGLELARKYQHGIKSVDYTNWRIKKIALKYTRKYSLQPIIVNLMATELNRLFKLLKANSPFGPVLSSEAKIEKIIIVRSPQDVPDYIPVSMESGVIIVTNLVIFGFWKETIVYNVIRT